MLVVNIASFEGFSAGQFEKLSAARESLQLVLNSQQFRDAVLNFTFDGQKTFFYRRNLFGRFIDQPFTNQQVLDIIMKSNEMPGDAGFNQMDLYLVLLPQVNPSVVGYGNPGSREIYTYRNWFENFSIAEYAGHITHEWCHKLGFDHSQNHTRKRKFSVPYAIGDLAEELIENN